MSRSDPNGIVHLSSPYTVEETIARLTAILDQRGIHILACIDHSGDAERSGLKMPPTKLLLFGNPKAGTPLMIAAPTTAIDLPLKALAWQEADGNVWLSYNTAEYIGERHGVPPGVVTNISVVGEVCKEAVRSLKRRSEVAGGSHES